MADTVFYTPYQQTDLDTIYNLLFCDNLDLYKTHFHGKVISPWNVLFADTPEVTELTKLATDATQESRVRCLASNQLHALGQALNPKKIFGVIVEVDLAGKLDVLAVYSDHRVRYINQSGKLVVIEDANETLANACEAVVASAKSIVLQIGPWDKPRLPPPDSGAMRLTFLMSDGLYFGQAPMNVLANDSLAGPLVNAATQLLQRVVNLGLEIPG